MSADGTPVDVDFTGARQTLLITLYGKALDSREPNSILHDDQAEAAVRRLDYDFDSLRVPGRDLRSAAVRARTYDVWTRRYLAAHPECVVLHLGCGLDTRVHRVDPPASVDWYDVDFPDVIELRRRLFPARVGYHTIGSSVTEAHLLAPIPRDRPVLVVAEGLTPYLPAADGVAMLRRITEHFPGGQLLIDGYNRLGVWILQRYRPVRATGARLEWSIGDPRRLETAVPGLVFDDEWWFGDDPEFARLYAWPTRMLIRILIRVPAVRHLGRGLRYHFGRHGA